jgi:hypothetical protein
MQVSILSARLSLIIFTISATFIPINFTPVNLYTVILEINREMHIDLRFKGAIIAA